MFASFALFIKIATQSMMTTLSSTSATSAIVRKRIRPRITGTGKPGKVTWDDSLSLDATTITLFITDHCKNCHKMTHKWCNHLPLCLKTSKYQLLLTFMSYCVLFCVLYREESANKGYCNTVDNLISPNTVSQNHEKPHTAELDDTAIPHVKIKITEIPHDKKPNTAIP